MTDYVNKRLDKFRRLGATGRFDQKRRRLADEYRQLDFAVNRPGASISKLDEQRARQRQ